MKKGDGVGISHINSVASKIVVNVKPADLNDPPRNGGPSRGEVPGAPFSSVAWAARTSVATLVSRPSGARPPNVHPAERHPELAALDRVPGRSAPRRRWIAPVAPAIVRAISATSRSVTNRSVQS